MSSGAYLANLVFLAAVFAAPLGSEEGRDFYKSAWIKVKGLVKEIQDDYSRLQKERQERTNRQYTVPEEPARPIASPVKPSRKRSSPGRTTPDPFRPPVRPRDTVPARPVASPEEYPAPGPPGGGDADNYFAQAKQQARAGIEGHDNSALKRAVQLCDQALAANPSPALGVEIRKVRYACMKHQSVY